MEQSILASTKTVLKVNPEEDFFDDELLQYINSAVSLLAELGAGDGTVVVDDATKVWADLGVAEARLGLIKQFVFLKVRQLFDPPQVGFLQDATEKQLKELEWRIANSPEAA